MPDLRQAIVARVEENEAEAKAEHDRIEAEKKGPLFAKLARLDKLSQNEDFLWFFEAYLAPIASREEKALKDAKKSKDDIYNACQRLDVATEIIGKMESERTKLGNELYPNPK